MTSRRRANRVVVVGSLNMDIVARVERLPTAGETVLGGTYFQAPGGKGANQAVAAARLGARVAMVGRVGDDAFGRELRRNARADGVDVRHVKTADAPTGIALIAVDDRGQNQIVVAPGANATLATADVEALSATIARADLVLLQLETPLETIAAAARAGKRVLLNAAPARPGLERVLPNVHVLVVNEPELRIVSGAEGDETTLAARLLRQVHEAVVVTLGARGALLVDQAGPRQVPSFRVNAVDTTAAGDAFAGALAAFAPPMGQPLDEAVRLACAAGALACTKLGAQPSLPTLPALDRFLRERGA